MKTTINFLLIMLTLSVFAGCASTGKATVYYPLNDEEQKVAEGVRHANDLFRKGEYSTASQLYSQLLEEYSSKDGSFETALLTNICLGYLEQGERQNFKDCAHKLKDISKGLSYLSRETQLVLELNNSLGDSKKTGDDLRIESRITNGITNVFQEVR